MGLVSISTSEPFTTLWQHQHPDWGILFLLCLELYDLLTVAGFEMVIFRLRGRVVKAVD